MVHIPRNLSRPDLAALLICLLTVVSGAVAVAVTFHGNRYTVVLTVLVLIPVLGAAATARGLLRERHTHGS
jgi:hypothetical protein